MELAGDLYPYIGGIVQNKGGILLPFVSMALTAVRGIVNHLG